VAWHEGQLFGVVNQVMGLITAMALVGLSLVGLLMWHGRRPKGGCAAPPGTQVKLGWAAIVIAALVLLLPLFGASVLAMLIVDRIRGKFVSN